MDIQRIKTMFKNNKSQYDSIFAFYRSMGLDISNRGSICPKSRIEMPTRTYEATIVRGRIRAFTYIGSDTFIHDTTIKRYCSIAKSVNIGHGNHPIHWLSTNPFMYDQGFRIRTGNLFPNHKDYVSYQVPQNNRIQLKKDVSLPPFTSIGNDVWIGTGAIILPNLTIGDGAIIGAGSVVTKDIPP